MAVVDIPAVYLEIFGFKSSIYTIKCDGDDSGKSKFRKCSCNNINIASLDRNAAMSTKTQAMVFPILPSSTTNMDDSIMLYTIKTLADADSPIF